MKSAPLILRIELLYLCRPVWREVLVPRGLQLIDLHDIIQAVMPWDDEHLHEFLVREGNRFVPLSPLSFDDDFDADPTEEDEVDEPIEAHLTRKGSKMRYLYDFGDGWEHEITLIGYAKSEHGKRLRCLAGEGAAPLEDCGGPPGDADIFERFHARKSGRRRKRDDRDDWIPDGYDPTFFDREAVNEDLFRLSKIMEEGRKKDAASEADDEFGEPEVPFPGLYDALTGEQAATFARLFKIAAELRKIAPWQAFTESNLLGWESPEDQRVRLISILGAGGEVRAIHAHLPNDGFRFWKRYFEMGPHQAPEDLEPLIHLTEVEFVDPKELEADDFRLYDLAGVPPPKGGRLTAIRFRYYHPRKRPWFLPPERAAGFERILRPLLALCKATIGKSRKLKALSKRLPHALAGLPDEIPIFRLRPGASADDGDAWDLVDTPVPWHLAEAPPPVYHPPVEEIFRVAGLPQKDEAWEIGSVQLSTPVMTDEGPVVAVLALVVRLHDEFIHPPHLEGNWRLPFGRIVWEAFCQTAHAVGHRPTELHVATDIAEATFTPAAEHGAFELKRQPEWQIVGRVLAEMEGLRPE